MSSALFVAIGAGVAVLTGIGAGIGIGKATAAATDAIARQPEAESKISKALLLGCALAEATAIYGFVIALLITGKYPANSNPGRFVSAKVNGRFNEFESPVTIVHMNFFAKSRTITFSMVSSFF